MSAVDSSRERLWELLADEATEGLDAARAGELERLLGEHADVDPDGVQLAAAACDLAFFAPTWRSMPAMPAGLADRVRSSYTPGLVSAPTRQIVRDARAMMARRVDGPVVGSPVGSARRGRWAAWAGWAAAAASLAVAAWAWTARPGAEPADAAAFALAHADVRRVAWTPGTDATGAGCGGEVVWSPSSQSGLMVFRGLRANDPRTEQYQLWIFDPARDERYPVHGGVFDVAAGATEVAVPIRPRLGVPGATTFVVTVERPGGVWVSDRSRIAALAKLQ